MPAFDPRDRSEVEAAKGRAGYGDRDRNAGRSGGLGRPTNAPFGGMPPRQFRRSVNPTTTRPLTAHNIIEALGMMPLGPMSSVGAMLGAVGVPGFAPEFEGPEGHAYGPGDYDPSNRFGTGLLARMRGRSGRGLQRTY